MPNLNSCSKCNNNISSTAVALDEMSGELMCFNCVDNYNFKIDEDCYNFLLELTNIHLDNLNNLYQKKINIINVINFLEEFLILQIGPFKMIKSNNFLRSMKNKSINLY